MRRVILSYLVCFSLLLLNPALPSAYAQDWANANPDYWAKPPDHDLPQNDVAQSYPPPAYGNAPYGDNPYGGDPAQEPAQQPNAPDPENAQGDQEHGVARLSIVDGEVNIRRGDTGEAVAAAVNAPLLTQDHVQTAPSGRAEVELDAGNVLRLAPNTELGFADIRYRRAQVQLGLGSVLYRVLRPSSSDVEIDTPSVGVRASENGEFRVSVYDDGTTQITVRTGRADVLSANGREPLNAGQSLLARGDSAHPEFQWVSPPAFDQLEGWSRERDRQLLASQSYRYVNPDINGADDLDRYGSWVPSQYGQVWQPQQPTADWAPYSYGDWTYEPYYGWTWVDSAPWGWAPYHYGRWFMNGGRGWCWWPGGVGVSAYWSPALVGFFGIGAGLGWAALAPFELFHPWWGFGFHGGWGGGYRGGPWGGYRNAGFRGGAIFAGPGQFGEHRGRYGFADRSQLAHATFISGRLPVSPGRGSYAFSNRAAFSNVRAGWEGNHNFFQAPQGRAGFAPSSGWGSRTSGSYSGNAHGVYSAPANRSYQQSRSQTIQGGWHSFGDPGRSSGAQQNFASQSSSQAWHSFGQAGHGWAQTPNANQARAPQTWQAQGQARSYGGSYSTPYAAPHSNWSGNSRPQSSGNAHYSQPHLSSSNGGGGHASHSEGGGHSSGGGGHHR